MARIGRHINISKGFVSAPSYAHSIGCNAFQIFLGTPRMLISKERQQHELQDFAAELTRLDMLVVVHGSYMINLCHAYGSKKYETSMKSLLQDLRASAILGPNCLGVVIHMGKNIKDNNTSDEVAIANYVDGIKRALEASPASTYIILETGASQGSEVGSRLTALASIYHALTKEEKKRIGFCIDTCHIWATGYDISSQKGVKQFFSRFDKLIGINKIKCIHFNDSKTDCNSHVDRHADLGYGFIDTHGLQEFASYSAKKGIPIIMETPLDAIDESTNREITFDAELAMVKNWIS